MNTRESFCQRLLRDQRGEMPIGTILVIALIVIPLVVLLIVFRTEVSAVLIDSWVSIWSAGNSPPPSNF